MEGITDKIEVEGKTVVLATIIDGKEISMLLTMTTEEDKITIMIVLVGINPTIIDLNSDLNVF